jgi:hypothetical protein
MRKLILLLLAVWAARKLSDQLGTGRRAPFPTASRPPEGYQG